MEPRLNTDVFSV